MKFESHGIPCRILFHEEHPEPVQKYGIRKSPTIIVDGEVAFVGMPHVTDLIEFIEKKKGASAVHSKQ